MKTEDTQSPSDVQQPQALAEHSEEEIAAQPEEIVSESSEKVDEKRPLWPDVPWTPIAKKNRWTFSLFLVITVIGALLGFRAFTVIQNRSSSEQTETVALEAQLPVKVVPVKTQPIQEWVFSPNGEVRASRFKHLTFDVAGTVTYVKDINGRDLEEGDYVRAGELLAKVDQRKSNQDLNVAKAAVFEAQQQVETAKANLKQAQNQLIQAEAELKQAQTNSEFAATDLKRYQELYQEGAIQGREVEVKETDFKNTQTAIAAAEAAVNSAQEGVTSADAQVQASQSGVSSAIAQLGKTKIDREDTEIKAPFNSQVAHLNIKEGIYWTPQRVQPNDDNSIPKTIPIIVIDPSSFEAYAQFPAFQGANVKPGQRAFVILDQDQSKASSGKVTSDDLMRLAAARGRVESVSPSVSPGERSVEVKVQIIQGAANLQDGSKIYAWIAVEEKNDATVAPFNAFVFRDQIPHVFVIKEENGKKVVEQRQVELGIEGISRREILRGVKPGELLVTDGKNRLVDGAPVDVVEIIK
ncbi:MAG: efflux transporter periplasmic adaptor subunit [Symploca sp. SIO2C1]|nr:efflux transporter periplasmic adaptor subunit [Symploca sp. SIO2C1]